MCLLRFLGRLAFEDVDALFSTLETLATKLGVSELKYTLLANFYALVKVIMSNYLNLKLKGRNGL